MLSSAKDTCVYVVVGTKLDLSNETGNCVKKLSFGPTGRVNFIILA